MTIDDELLLEILKPESNGKVGDGALIIGIAGTKKVSYKLEESTCDTKAYGTRQGTKLEVLKMTPDILVNSSNQEIAIEIENDIQWDFQSSLKQLKKYKGKFSDTRVIIPADYKRFAPLYKNEEVRVYLWKAERKWQCLKCGTETTKEGPVIPICSNSNCKNHSTNDFRLIGLKGTSIEEF